MVFPVNFAIPREKVCRSIPIKEKILAHIIPGDAKTYIFDTEDEYYADYQKSYFAITKKKAGWDCLRLLPKDLFIKGNELYDRISKKTFEELEDMFK